MSKEYIKIYGRRRISTTKVFMTGRSQAIRLPKEFRFEGKEVEIFRRGVEVTTWKTATADRVLKILVQMPNDFYAEGKVDEPPQEREEFWQVEYLKVENWVRQVL